MRQQVGKAWLDAFDSTYVINLATRADRRKQAMQELGRLGLVIEAGDVQFFPAIQPADSSPFASRGEKGCYLSHLEVLRRIRDSSATVAAILEDDFCFFRHFLRNGVTILEALHCIDWDIVQLAPLDYDPRRRFSKHPLWSEARRWGFGTHFYAVRRAAAGRIADCRPPRKSTQTERRQVPNRPHFRQAPCFGYRSTLSFMSPARRLSTSLT
jgi:glycosyl transferase, family 25